MGGTASALRITFAIFKGKGPLASFLTRRMLQFMKTSTENRSARPGLPVEADSSPFEIFERIGLPPPAKVIGPARGELRLIRLLCVATSPLQAGLALAVLRPGDDQVLSMLSWTLKAYGVLVVFGVAFLVSGGSALMSLVRRRRVS